MSKEKKNFGVHKSVVPMVIEVFSQVECIVKCVRIISLETHFYILPDKIYNFSALKYFFTNREGGGRVVGGVGVTGVVFWYL